MIKPTLVRHSINSIQMFRSCFAASSKFWIVSLCEKKNKKEKEKENKKLCNYYQIENNLFSLTFMFCVSCHPVYTCHRFIAKQRTIKRAKYTDSYTHIYMYQQQQQQQKRICHYRAHLRSFGLCTQRLYIQKKNYSQMIRLPQTKWRS